MELTGTIPRDYSPQGYSKEELREAKLIEVKEDAERLGIVVLDKKEYARLVANEKKYFKILRDREGWPASLVV
jgi:hypothetical protein